jgi:hypothetical protein
MGKPRDVVRLEGAPQAVALDLVTNVARRTGALRHA